MPVYSTRPRKGSYGFPMGIMVLDEPRAFTPGDVANAESYDYPVFYRVIPGATTQAVARGDPTLEQAVIDTARALELKGVKAISGASGHLVHYQASVASVLKVPVLLSSLSQLPFISMTLGEARAIGVITADSRLLGNRSLELSGVASQRAVVVKGMEEEEHFRRSVLDGSHDLDTDEIRAEIVAVARRLVDERPETGAILLESPMMPPYAAAIRQATGRAVFDYMTMIGQLKGVTHHAAPAGYY